MSKRTYECPACGGTMHVDPKDDDFYICEDCEAVGYLDGTTMELYDEDRDEGCIACGCDLYPDCKESCPLFDDN